jgi:thioesterase domain-containing protein
MYIIRDIFQLRFGAFKEARALLEEAYSKGLLPDAKSARVLSDFTGDSYRLIFEEGHDTLAAYEQSLSESMNKTGWKKWYESFKQHVTGSHREILKQLL